MAEYRLSRQVLRYGRLFWFSEIRAWDMTGRIVIVAGGFAGVHAAMYFDKALAHRSDIDVVLISRENFILFTGPERMAQHGEHRQVRYGLPDAGGQKP